jgi:SAM-dependent methyltransferase
MQRLETAALRSPRRSQAMAITTIDYAMFDMLHRAGIVAKRPVLLELGEAQWYADVPVRRLSDSIEEYIADVAERDRLQQRLATLAASDSPTRGWDRVKLLYEVLLDVSRVVSIDFHGSPAAQRIDLNQSVDLGEQFDVVYNGGTAEHIFNVYEFFRTVHRVTRPRGVMLHGVPFQGWLEHGFYSFNPGFFWDLADANGYQVFMLAYAQLKPAKLVPLKSREHIVELHNAGELAANSLLYAVLGKGESESEFKVPMQGVYADKVSGEMLEAWHTLR